MEYTRGYVMNYEKNCIGIKLMKRTCIPEINFKPGNIYAGVLPHSKYPSYSQSIIYAVYKSRTQYR